MVYSRFGARQWAGPLPRTRVVVKDPYALLSMPAVAAATGATPVLVYRHPGADPRQLPPRRLAAAARRGGSDRRAEHTEVALGWTCRRSRRAAAGHRPRDGRSSGRCCTSWRSRTPPSTGALVVSHAELARGGEGAGRALADRLGLGGPPRWRPSSPSSPRGGGGVRPAAQLRPRSCRRRRGVAHQARGRRDRRDRAGQRRAPSPGSKRPGSGWADPRRNRGRGSPRVHGG